MVLAVTMLIAIVAVFLYIYFNRRDKEKIKKILILALVIGLLGAGIIVFNIGGIRNTSYYDNFISRDGGIIGNVRFKMIWEMLQLLPSHWKGGATVHLYGMNAIHNYWLQVANDTGIFTFILWMIFNISALYSTVKVVISPHIKEGLKYALVLMLVAAASYLMMEIGGSGRSTYIIFYIMLVAIMKQTLKNIETT